MDTTLHLFEEKYNFKLTVTDANASQEKYMNLVEIYCEQGVDGMILMCTEDIGARVYEVTVEYGIPIIAETIAMMDPDGTYLLPCVELNPVQVGEATGQWLAENYQNYFGEITDWSKVGYCIVTYMLLEQMITRTNACTDKFLELMPQFDKNNVFMADMLSQGVTTADAAYNVVAPVIAANPQIEIWLFAGAQDVYAQGAVRAMEESGIADVGIMCSMGGENLIPEWEAGYEGCWVSAIYFDAYNYSEQLVPAIIALVDGTVTLESLWPDRRMEGQTFSSYRIEGRPILHDTYKDIVAFY